MVDVSKSWRRSELEPFQRLIKTGMADSVLVAHLLNTQIDPSRPMSLSKKAITDLLRGQLGFKGPVVSDDMQATGITKKYGHDEALSLALQAGMDLLVYANQQQYDAGIVEKTLDAAVKLVKNGTLTEAQIDAAVARVDTLRPKVAGYWQSFMSGPVQVMVPPGNPGSSDAELNAGMITVHSTTRKMTSPIRPRTIW